MLQKQARLSEAVAGASGYAPVRERTVPPLALGDVAQIICSKTGAVECDDRVATGGEHPLDLVESSFGEGQVCRMDACQDKPGRETGLFVFRVKAQSSGGEFFNQPVFERRSDRIEADMIELFNIMFW